MDGETVGAEGLALADGAYVVGLTVGAVGATVGDKLGLLLGGVVGAADGLIRFVFEAGPRLAILAGRSSFPASTARNTVNKHIKCNL